MKKNTLYVKILIGLFALLAVSSVTAQRGLVVKQQEITYDQNILYQLDPDNPNMQNPEKRKSLILNADVNKLNQIASESGQEPNVEKSTIYVLNKNFRMDSQSREHNWTVILRKDLNKLFQIDWNTNIVIEISLDQMEQMQKNAASQMQKNMPNLEKMLENLPPQQRQEALEGMKKSGYDLPGMKTKKSQPTVKKTGRTKTIKSFSNCEEYLIQDGDKTISLWATAQNPALVKKFHQIAQEFKNSFQFDEDDENEPWELVKDRFPVLVKTFEENWMQGGGELKVQEFLSAEEIPIPLSKFEEFKNPKLKKRSMKDMTNFDPNRRK
ncbi:MAG: hypothetical protein ACE5HS_18955 [bacterium]